MSSRTQPPPRKARKEFGENFATCARADARLRGFAQKAPPRMRCGEWRDRIHHLDEARTLDLRSLAQWHLCAKRSEGRNGFRRLPE
ncbi:hypothetical protein LVB77_07810 [Lysobacter sp. 5GHs7-4]|uniref:hypothetical protein n=1 Tax=Lysobacter sp. 5GHs7-4 TaxID=2904253 RepID=UPI001E4A80F1|nr:hypothetical protein [Lysobacter sp. 5GHs7-4]UHQ24579.1 hypothetical protein LVB77_07810 [Lysobacter sp. 5GHs7-4]